MSNRQFLVICRVGDNSLHKEWIADRNRNFDLHLSYFGNTPEKYRADAEFYDETKGPKWPILHKIIMEQQERIAHYDAVWLPDDDLSMPTRDINRMFNLFSALNLKLGQPALTLNSHVAHKELISEPGTLARHVNFIEIMAPIFSREGLRELQHTFIQSPSGWGLDYLWPVLLNHKDIAILDATPMIHTRPLGGELYKNNEMSPRNDIDELVKLYPEHNLAKNYKPNKFHIFSQVKNIYHSKLYARLLARITRRKNRTKYTKSVRYGTQNN